MTRRLKRPKRALQEKADAAWQYWMLGYLAPGEEFANDDEERQCWDLVRKWHIENYPTGNVDKFGCVELGCHGWWKHETPEAVDFVQIEGLPDDFAVRYQKLQYLKSWGMVPVDVKDHGLVMRATEIATYYQRRVTNSLRGFWYPFPTGVSDEAKERTWQEVKAEYQAWLALGYVTEDPHG